MLFFRDLPPFFPAFFLVICLAILPAYPQSSYYNKRINAPARRVLQETIIVTRDTLWSDGQPRPGAVLFNGTSPGPAFRFRVGDVALVRVVNKLQDENTTIHFHGLTQALFPTSDGTPMLSQWAIAPDCFFEYELHLGPNDIGSTFYHSHFGLQITSALGPLVVEEEEPLDAVPSNAEERMMVLGDYFYRTDAVMARGLLGAPFVWPGSAQSVLLNGRGAPAAMTCNATLAMQARVTCAQSTYNGTEIVDVAYDRPYRMRWVGSQTLTHLAVGIFHHTFSLIAADGTPIVPVNTTTIEVMGGQRYDTVLRTRSATQVAQDGLNGCYPIRMEARWRLPATNGWALLRYPDAHCDPYSIPPTIGNNSLVLLPAAKFGWISDKLHPLPSSPYFQPPRDDEVSRRVILETQQVSIALSPTPKATSSGIRWDVNDEALRDDAPLDGTDMPIDAPYLIQVFTNQTDAPSYERAMTPPAGVQRGFDETSQTYVGQAGEVLEVVLINNGSAINNVTETHPFHLHGVDHWTVALGTGAFTEEKFVAAKAHYAPAVSRDTTGVWPGDGASNSVPAVLLPANASGAWSVIRFRVPADGSATGVWAFHCHWAFHQIMGMMTIWSFGPLNASSSPLKHYSDPDYLFFGRNVSAPYRKLHRLS